MKDLVDADRDLRGVFVSNAIIAEGASQVVYNKSSGDRINYVALAASKGEKVPTTLDTGANVITKANLSSPRSQELLNPKSGVLVSAR
jgi:ribose transport system substrate-binding protein